MVSFSRDKVMFADEQPQPQQQPPKAALVQQQIASEPSSSSSSPRRSNTRAAPNLPLMSDLNLGAPAAPPSSVAKPWWKPAKWKDLLVMTSDIGCGTNNRALGVCFFLSGLGNLLFLSWEHLRSTVINMAKRHEAGSGWTPLPLGFWLFFFLFFCLFVYISFLGFLFFFALIKSFICVLHGD